MGAQDLEPFLKAEFEHELKILQAVFPNHLTELKKDSKTGLWIKDETITPSESFKFRGAKYWFSLCAEGDNKPVVISSTGNLGVAFALLANEKKIPVHVFVPLNSNQIKINKMKELGAIIHECGSSLTESLNHGIAFASSNKFRVIKSLDRSLINGNASLIVEALKQEPSISKLFFPVGVGAGFAGQIRGKIWTKSNIDLIAVLHKANASWLASIEAKAPTTVQPNSSLALGLRVATPDLWAFDWLRLNSKFIITIDDKDLIHAKEITNYSPKNPLDLTSLVSIAGALKYKQLSSEDLEDSLAVLC